MPSKRLKRLIKIAKGLPEKDLAQQEVKLGQAKKRDKALGGSRQKLQAAAKALGQ